MDFEKQIKRHIHAQQHSFFMITPVGFENIGKEELSKLNIESNVEVGGVEFIGKLEDFYKATLYSRVATRFLMRVKSFKSDSLGPFFKNILSIKWEYYLKNDSTVFFHVTSRGSKLYHQRMLEEKFRDALSEYSNLNSMNLNFETQDSEFEIKNGVTIYLRLEDDRATISIDLSGAPNFKRGYRKFISDAPIRENLASGLLLNFWKNREKPFLDLMCGSGTFTLEAISILKNIPAGGARDFSFMNLSHYKEAMFKHTLKKSDEDIIELKNREFFFSDIVEKHVIGSRRNLVALGEKSIKSAVLDFFEFKPNFKERGFLVLNPPYGKRIQEEPVFYKELYKKLSLDFKGWELLLLLPEAERIKTNFQNKNRVVFENGGIPIQAVSGIIE
ncbi:hypothetical protein JXR93_05475 [bacterium]|nr:hypothetical protein [bacterium]